MRIDESIYRILYDAMEITGTDYNIKWFDKDTYDGYIDEDDMVCMIDDLLYEIDRLNEQIEELNKPNDYFNEERDREKQVLGL